MTFPTIAATNQSVQATNATSHTIDLPSGISSGDLLIASVVTDGRPGNQLGGTLSDDWVFLVADSDNLDLLRLYIYFRRATGGEGSTVGFTTFSFPQCSAHRTYRITGAHDSTDPVAGIVNIQDSVTINPPALNPVAWDIEDTLWFVFVGNDDGTTTVSSFPTSYTDTGQVAADGAADGVNLAWCRRNNAIASEDPSVVTLSTNESCVAVTLGVRPLSATTVVPNTVLAPITLYQPFIQNMTLQPPAVAAPAGFAEGPSVVIVVLFGLQSFGAVVQSPTVVSLGTQQNIDPPVLAVAVEVQTPSVYHLVVVTRAVLQGSDDGYETPSASPNITDTVLAAVDTGDHIGVRFQSVQVPKNANVYSASMTLVVANSDKNDTEGTWYGQAADGPDTFTTTDDDIVGRVKTTASAAWTTNDLGTEGTSISTPSLLPIVDELVNRAGWSAGNSMVFLYSHNSATDQLWFASYENTSYTEPTLVVQYLALVETIFVGLLSAPVQVQQPSVGAGIQPALLTVASTLFVPIVNLGVQYVGMFRVDAGAFVWNPSVVGEHIAVGLLVTIQDLLQGATVVDPDFSATIVEGSFALALSDTSSVTVQEG